MPSRDLTDVTLVSEECDDPDYHDDHVDCENEAQDEDEDEDEDEPSKPSNCSDNREMSIGTSLGYLGSFRVI